MLTFLSEKNVLFRCLKMCCDYHTFRTKNIIAKAYEVDCVLESPQDSDKVFNQSEGGKTQNNLKYQDKYNLLAVGDPHSEIDQSHPIVDKVPDHLREVFEVSCKHLDNPQQQKLADLLIDNEEAFAKTDFDLGNFTTIEHSIDTKDAPPIKSLLRRTPACFVGEEEAHLKKMLDAGVIQESISEWASSPVLIRKRDGTVRWCIDYRALNDVTVKDTFPLPLVDDCLDTLVGNIWFSKLDANSAYWQVLVKEEDRKKTAFLTKFGLFEHVKMGFGLTNAPATYSRVVNFIMRGLTWKTVLAFLDDILVMGKTFEEHLTNLTGVLRRFQVHGMKLKPRKCIFFQKEVEFLGRMVSKNRLSMAKKDIETVVNWAVPRTSKDVERFLGLANYHRTFVKDFAEHARPLYCLTGKGPYKCEKK